MKKNKLLKKAVSILSSAIIALEIVIIIFIVITKISGGVPSLFGYHMYVIVSPSMSPEIKVGDVIISKKYENETLDVDDVVQYVGRGGDIEGKIITHKIISIDGEGSDATIVTQGVANPSPDRPIKGSDVVAVMKYKTVLIGPLYKIFSSTAGFIFLVMLPLAGMIIFEVVNLALELKKEKEKEKEEEEQQND